MYELRKLLTVWFFTWLGLGWAVSIALTDSMNDYRDDALYEIVSSLDADDREKVEALMPNEGEGDTDFFALYDWGFVVLSAVIALFALNIYNKHKSENEDKNP